MSDDNPFRCLVQDKLMIGASTNLQTTSVNNNPSGKGSSAIKIIFYILQPFFNLLPHPTFFIRFF